MKSHKLLIVFLVVVILSFSFSNYSAVNTIDESAYVIAIGFDTADNGNIKLSLQIAIPSAGSSGSSSSSDSQSASSVVNTVECSTLFSGINLVNSYLSKKLNLSYCKVAVFSEDFASKGISEFISTMINDIEIRPTCHIVISRCEAKYYLENSKPMLADISSKYYEIVDSSEKNTGFTKAVTILDFYNSYYDSFVQPYAILGSINGANSGDIEDSDFSNKSSIQLNDKLDNISFVDSQSSGSSEKSIENLRFICF